MEKAGQLVSGRRQAEMSAFDAIFDQSTDLRVRITFGLRFQLTHMGITIHMGTNCCSIHFYILRQRGGVPCGASPFLFGYICLR